MLYYEYNRGAVPWKFRKDMVNFMKKRIAMLLSGLLALSLLTFSMTSCLEEGTPEDDDDEDEKQTDGSKLNGKTPEELYAEALSAVNESLNWEMASTQEIKMVMTYNGETVEQEQTQTIEQKMNGEDVYVKIGGSALEMESWYVDGIFYTISGDVKAKAELSLKEYQEQMTGSADQTLLNIPSEWFKDIKFEEKDGKNCLNFHVSGEEYADVVGNLFESMNIDASAKIGEVDYTVVFDKKGNIEQILCDFSAEFEIQGIAVKADYHTVTDVKIGTAGEITAPADGDSFIDVTDQMDSIG